VRCPIRDFDVLDDRTQGVFATILRGFVMVWTVFMGLLSIVVMMAVTKDTENLTSHAEIAGAGLGMALGMIRNPMVPPSRGSSALNFLIRKHSMVENGPINWA
jgi:hypothetical protein